MSEEHVIPPRGEPPRHEQGDPVSLEQDPAQVEPTGGEGLLDPANDAERDLIDMPNADEIDPEK
jgi:hypothetical protein